MSAQTDGAATRRGPMGGHGPGHGMMPGEKPKDFKGTLKKMIGFMGRFKAALVVVLVFAIGSTVFNIVGPKVLSTATTELFNGIVAKIDGSGGINFDAIAQILLFTLGLYLLSAACSFVQGWIMSSVSQRTSYELRRSIAEKIDRMPMGYFERNSVGDTLSRITNDVDTLGQSLNQGVTQLITSVTTIIGVLVMMLTINPLMTLVTVVILPVSVVLIMVVVKRSQKFFLAQQRTLGEINGLVEETFSGHAIVKAFNREDGTVDNFNAVSYTHLGLFGQGYMQGSQHALGILPEAPTDFIFCVLAEELGFFGVVVLLGLYLALVLVSFRIAGSAGDLFGLLIVMCVVGMWLFQILENIGMTCGLMPITGIPLPFMSYGSTGTIMNFIMLGLIGSVWAHNTATGKKGSYADTR